MVSGDILVDDRMISHINKLNEKLKEVTNLQGAVWYYRENSTNTPNEVADEVFRLILDTKLPFSLSTKSDFSDWIDANGKSRLR